MPAGTGAAWPPSLSTHGTFLSATNFLIAGCVHNMLRSITNWILGSGSTPNQAFDRNSLLGFSQAVVDKLIRDTNSLSQGPGILRIKGSLRSSLESLKRHLEEISTNPHSQQSGQEQILVVLGCLERICEVNATPSRQWSCIIILQRTKI